MSETPERIWADQPQVFDDDDPKLRALFQYQLRTHVRHQDGRDSLAPTLVFADADYEVCDGVCGLHADAKSANEPAIVFARADALVDAVARIEADAKVIEAANELAKAQTAFIAAEIDWKATPKDRGGKSGPKGKAVQRVSVKRKAMIEALAAFNAALEAREKRGE